MSPRRDCPRHQGPVRLWWIRESDGTVNRSILITGMSGLIGTAVRERLEPRARLAALNRSDVPGVATVRADVADLDAIRPAFEGQDTVIHLAAKVGDGCTWEELLETNVIGTRNVFEAARLAGCKRIVFASSGATIAGWEHEEPYRALVEGRYDDVPADWLRIRHDMVTRPKGPYASTKIWGEALARYYADSFDLSAIVLRIGYVNAEDRPTNAPGILGLVQPTGCRQRHRTRRRPRRFNALRHLLHPVRQQMGLSRSLPRQRGAGRLAAGCRRGPSRVIAVSGGRNGAADFGARGGRVPALAESGRPVRRNREPE